MTTGINPRRIVVLLSCLALSYVWAIHIREAAQGGIRAIDFGGLYYGARCAIEHKDPYDPQVMLREFRAEGGKLPTTNPEEEESARTTLSVVIYPPTAFLVLSPISFLSWPIANAAWLDLTCALLLLASYLMWDLASEAPILAGGMTAFVLLNCAMVLMVGNAAAFVAGVSVAGSYCIVRERFATAGVLMLALGLVIKPHDAGLIWLYFLLAGPPGRKRALQALAVAAALGILSVAWIGSISPRWTNELHHNLEVYAVRGGATDPGPTGLPNRGFMPNISLQNTLSIFNNDPRFYNPASYVISGGLILGWAIAVLRKRASMERALLALASISFLTMLPVYHRTYDTKLFLLAIPACATLWAAKGAKRWAALALTSLAIFVTSDIPVIFVTAGAEKLPVDLSTLKGKLTLLALQPAPLVLLAAGCFYLWVFAHYEDSPAGMAEPTAIFHAYQDDRCVSYELPAEGSGQRG